MPCSTRGSGVAEAAAARPGRRWTLGGPLVAGAWIALAALVAAGLFADVVAPYSPTAVDARAVFRGPSSAHPFGTDRFGRDMLSRLIFGIRVSLGIAGASIAMALLAGATLGLLAGAGRAVDQALGRLMDVFFAFPPILLAIAIAAVLGAGPGTAVVAIAVVYAPLFFRVVRGSVLAESALCYLGVGVQPPTPSWGAILNEGKEFLALAPWVSLFPGGFIMLAVLSFNVIGDGLRDIFDPRVETR